MLEEVVHRLVVVEVYAEERHTPIQDVVLDVVGDACSLAVKVNDVRHFARRSLTAKLILKGMQVLTVATCGVIAAVVVAPACRQCR